MCTQHHIHIYIPVADDRARLFYGRDCFLFGLLNDVWCEARVHLRPELNLFQTHQTKNVSVLCQTIEYTQQFS